LRARRDKAGREAIFAPALTPAQRAAFARLFPHRVAFKHAHSLNNPEANWGLTTLQSIEFAFHVLNTHHRAATAFEPANTIVIASSVSNGAGAALKAAEQDVDGLIDGVAVTEPQVQVGRADGYQVVQGGVAVAAHGKTLFDYTTYAALYQSCIGGHLVRCASLADKGLLSGATPVLQMADAYARMRAYGWGRETDLLLGVHAATNVLIAVTYAYGYGRFPVTDSLCGLRFGSADASGAVRGFSAERRAQSFANQSGIPGSVLYEDSVGGVRAYHLAVSPSSGLADQGLDAFLCLRAMSTGVDPVSGRALEGERLAQSQRLQAGVAQVLASGNLHGKPAIVVQGRSDAMVPPNHGARAYVGLNSLVEGAGSRLRYIEVSNANHFDIFASTLPSAIVPLHPYLFEALDAMYAHLKTGAPLPPSQVVRTLPRWSGLQPMTRLNLPHVQPAVDARDRILASPGVLSIPD
jgi:hydroxybutyrate-dimer hydrolase